jgi:hypothetical protein
MAATDRVVLGMNPTAGLTLQEAAGGRDQGGAVVDDQTPQRHADNVAPRIAAAHPG